MSALSSHHTFSGFLRGTALKPKQCFAPSRKHAAVGPISARYRGQGTDLSKVPQFKRHEEDTGSAEVQISRLTARVAQLTAHLQTHSKDFATRRGLMAILSQRKQLLLYLQRTNQSSYEKVIAELGIRQLKTDL